MSTKPADLQREFGNDRAAKARAFLSRSKARLADDKKKEAKKKEPKKKKAAKKKDLANTSMAEQIAKNQKKQAAKNKRMGMDKPAVYTLPNRRFTPPPRPPPPRPPPRARLLASTKRPPPPRPPPPRRPPPPTPTGELADLQQLLFNQGEFDLLNSSRRGYTFL
tara:strand:+ start:136 stop:627 length:492 start_codon:yes stop_codon:yes gene_type:complete